jgi:hypothetical protein
MFKNPQGCGFLIQSTCYCNPKNKKMKPESPEIKVCKYKSWSAGTNVAEKKCCDGVVTEMQQKSRILTSVTVFRS